MRLISIFLIGLGLACCSSDQKKKEEEKTSEKDPLIELKTLEGQPIDLTQHEDETIFINFWATWCGPCIKEMPSLERMEEALKDEPVVFYYASIETKNQIESFKKSRGFNLNFVQQITPLPDLDIYALPTTYLIKNGEIVYGMTGSTDWDDPKLIEELKQVIHNEKQ